MFKMNILPYNPKGPPAQKQQHKGGNKTLALFKRQTKEQRLRAFGVRIIRFKDNDVMNRGYERD